jgi:hypothetical protein
MDFGAIEENRSSTPSHTSHHDIRLDGISKMTNGAGEFASPRAVAAGLTGHSTRRALPSERKGHLRLISGEYGLVIQLAKLTSASAHLEKDQTRS